TRELFPVLRDRGRRPGPGSLRRGRPPRGLRIHLGTDRGRYAQGSPPAAAPPQQRQTLGTPAAGERPHRAAFQGRTIPPQGLKRVPLLRTLIPFSRTPPAQPKWTRA